MQKIIPYLWFKDQAEEAVNFYTSAFKNSAIHSVTRLDDAPGPDGGVVMLTFRLAGQAFMAMNGGPAFDFSPSVSFSVCCQDREEIDALWGKLAAGGTVLMELDQYPFGERYGWVQDRYGLSWQLSLTHQPQKISPCLMFVGEQHGRAEEAIRFYTGLFDNSSIEQIARYGEDSGETPGTVMYASFKLNGQEFLAMESSLEHSFTFTPAVSFFVDCADQAEVDYFWNKLTEGGEEQACGWLRDKFGVSWQIIPTALGRLMSDPDPERAGRVTQAMLKMKKIEIDQLQQAYEHA